MATVQAWREHRRIVHGDDPVSSIDGSISNARKYERGKVPKRKDISDRAAIARPSATRLGNPDDPITRDGMRNGNTSAQDSESTSMVAMTTALRGHRSPFATLTTACTTQPNATQLISAAAQEGHEYASYGNGTSVASTSAAHQGDDITPAFRRKTAQDFSDSDSAIRVRTPAARVELRETILNRNDVQGIRVSAATCIWEYRKSNSSDCASAARAFAAHTTQERLQYCQSDIGGGHQVPASPSQSAAIARTSAAQQGNSDNEDYPHVRESAFRSLRLRAHWAHAQRRKSLLPYQKADSLQGL
ncbi:hypothetical protein EDB84DRAFT_1447066 [Lactarius hengduanensis]|nr:hypothetical protein EDB84DRAFT_1447066 [Lactarius hengduanensis]